MNPPLDPGATLVAPGTCRFLVWAPKSRQVTLRLTGPLHRDLPMQPVDHGYHTLTVEGIAPGQRYWYRLDSGPDRTDPASRWQPDGVHAPSAVDDPDFDWSGDHWAGKPFSDLILYEFHVGTFTREGTFDGVIRELPRLRDLGVNAIEIMPIAQFPGSRNWGYDGVYPFAVQHSYGGTRGLKRLVRAAHAQGISVFLDVVYNHLGPEGNYFRSFGPWFTDQYRTPWGEPFNFDGPGADAVRDYFLANARRWQTEFHLDGLRLDAVPFIRDHSARHILAEIADQARALSKQTGRPFHLIAECDLNDPRYIRPVDRGGLGLTAQWADDFHHALHAYLTGERTGYYSDFGGLAHLARVYQDGYFLTGQYSSFRGRRYGALPSDCAGEQFVIFTQNHDQIGNRVRADRLASHLDLQTLKLLAALLLTAPFVPMLFMGEEYGEMAPFPFFISHGDGGLIDRVRKGRKQEFAAFAWHGEPHDPASEQTFQIAKLDTSRAEQGNGRRLHDWHRELIRVRRSIPALAQLDRSRTTVHLDEAQETLLVRRAGEGQEIVLLLFHFGKGAAKVRVDLGEGPWQKILDSQEDSNIPHKIAGGEVQLPLSGRALLGFHRGMN